MEGKGTKMKMESVGISELTTQTNTSPTKANTSLQSTKYTKS